MSTLVISPTYNEVKNIETLISQILDDSNYDLLIIDDNSPDGTADKVKKPVNICGQMSGNILYTMLLLGFGLRHFSVPPASLLEIKKVISSVNIKQCQRVARRVMTMEHAQDIRNYLKEELRKQVPELVP